MLIFIFVMIVVANELYLLYFEYFSAAYELKTIFPGNFFLAMQCGLWDLSSLTRRQTRTPTVEAWSLNPWTAMEVPFPDKLFLLNLCMFQELIAHIFCVFFLSYTSVSLPFKVYKVPPIPGE